MSGERARGAAAPHAYASLRQDIVTGRLAGDSPLVEGLLARRYGVSRTPVREALRRLEQDGLVKRGARGFEVRSYTADELFELYEARILCEGFAARSAAERHRAVDAARMREAHRRMVGLPGDAEAQQRVGANQRFHRAIWQAAGNRTVLDMLSRLYLHVVRHTTLTDHDRWRCALDEHEQVLDAILRRDPETAEQAMVTHLETGRDVSLLLLEPEDPRFA
ncbi:MAG: FCD domain-containing protein [Nitriliruptorales bacterium]|nr:FCD domain-containing protein [Nitriliruptorales bacterium]